MNHLRIYQFDADGKLKQLKHVEKDHGSMSIDNRAWPPGAFYVHWCDQGKDITIGGLRDCDIVEIADGRWLVITQGEASCKKVQVIRLGNFGVVKALGGPDAADMHAWARRAIKGGHSRLNVDMMITVFMEVGMRGVIDYVQHCFEE